ncbi:hypothetical protein [Saccharopolyspora griseoalba]|uniref:Uncharacterized protein n=1 Tax=Saccharopolyspora griseoalba TaxID=1431848 RepID=A0ABW2LN85_9PSEU
MVVIRRNAHGLPARVEVSYGDGSSFVGVPVLEGEPVADGPSRFRFDPVVTDRLRFDLVSAKPGARDGFLGVGELRA